MKKIFSYFLVFLSIIKLGTIECLAQWQQINGVYGGIINCIVSDGANVYAGTEAYGVFRSTNNGESWTQVNSGLLSLSIGSLAINNTKIYAGLEGKGICMSTDNGSTWVAMNVGLPSNFWAMALAIKDTNIFAGTLGGEIYLSTNSGVSWAVCYNGLQGNGSIRSMTVVGTNIFAGADHGVWLSTNNGSSWSAMNIGLPVNSSVSSFGIISTNIFIATTNGVFLSSNNGTNWMSVNSGLPNIEVSSLIIYSSNIFAGIYGGGVYMSTNNGNSWTEVNLGFSENIYITDLATSETNIIAGAYGVLWKRPLSQIIGYKLNGIVSYYNSSNTPLGNATVKLMNGTTQINSTITDTNGVFSFNNVVNGNYILSFITAIPWSGVTATDALKTRRHIAGFEILSEPIKLSAADVSNSNTITAVDILKIQRRIAGLDNSFLRPEWNFEKSVIGGNNITINGANLTQNIYALCTGDVDGSYVPNCTTLPIVYTNAVNNIVQVSAHCGGNVINHGGSTVTDRGICWSLSPNPTINDFKTIDGNGTGIFSSTILGLNANTTYYFRAYATNSIGTSYGNEISFSTLPVVSNCGSVTDIDGNIYNTVKIGSQCWMKENLKTTKYSDGTSMVDGTGAGNINNNYTTKYYFDYNDNPANSVTYGKLYTWAAVMNGIMSSTANPSGVQGICPIGWHVPSDSEWSQLIDYLGGVNEAGGKMKDVGLQLWTSPNTDANNCSGFTALPGGGRFGFGNYYYIGNYADWWSTSENNSISVWRRYLHYNRTIVDRIFGDKVFGLSIRCIKD